MSHKIHECWSTDPNVYALRVEVSPNRSVQIPYDHLLHTELITGSDTQELRLIFVTHEVMVTGSCLRRIEASIQRRELAHLSVPASSGGRRLKATEPIIDRIELRTVDRIEDPTSVVDATTQWGHGQNR